MARAIGAGGKRRLLVAVALLAVVGGAVAGAATAERDAGTKVLRIGVAGVGESISNPAVNSSSAGQTLSIAYASILHQNPDGSIAPGLAISWHYVKGQKVFEFTLRRNARFSDGTPVTAAAVVAWLSYYAHSKNDQSSFLGPNPKFTAVGKWTVRVTLTVPDPDLPLTFAEPVDNWGFVASPKAVAKPSLFTKATYGAGPYKLDYSSTVPGDHYTFVPNPTYWDRSAIKFKQVYVKVFTDQGSELQALEAGQIDVMTGADATSASAASSAGLQIVSAPNAVQFIQLNAKASKPLADVRVRQAMNYAIDRTAINNATAGKYGSPTSQTIIPTDANPGLDDYYKYDPAKAKSLLAAAGYANGFSYTIDTIPTWTNVAGLVAHYLDAVGIKTTVNTFQTTAAYFGAVFAYKDDSWMLAAGIGGPTPLDYAPWVGTGSSFRPAEPSNPRIDSLYYAGLNTAKTADSIKYWKQMWAITVTDAWFLPISTVDSLVFASKSIGGIQMSAARGMALPAEWFSK
jgi:peptide/nickel transport system substrate-binding protein